MQTQLPPLMSLIAEVEIALDLSDPALLFLAGQALATRIGHAAATAVAGALEAERAQREAPTAPIVVAAA